MIGEQRAVLFDLDGTLVDTAPDMVRVLDAMMREQGLATLPYETVRSHVSNGSMGLLRLGFPEAGETALRELQQDYLERYAGAVCRDSRLFPGLAELLDTLDRHERRWGVVTNKPARMTHALLDALDLGERAACIVSGDTLPQRKPHPAPLLLASREAGVDPGVTLYVGDALRDIEAGKAAGMTTVAVAYGYIVDGDDAAAWQADLVAGDPAELTQIIAKAVNLPA